MSNNSSFERIVVIRKPFVMKIRIEAKVACFDLYEIQA